MWFMIVIPFSPSNIYYSCIFLFCKKTTNKRFQTGCLTPFTQYTPFLMGNPSFIKKPRSSFRISFHAWLFELLIGAKLGYKPSTSPGSTVIRNWMYKNTDTTTDVLFLKGGTHLQWLGTGTHSVCVLQTRMEYPNEKSKVMGSIHKKVCKTSIKKLFSRY